MIYLLGLRHSMQTEWDSPEPHLAAKFERLKAFLSETVRSTAVEAIAEETNQEFENCSGKKSLSRLVAEASSPPLRYVPCEPNSAERKALGIPTAQEIVDRCRTSGCVDDRLEQCRDSELLKYFPAREKCWLERIRQVSVGPILLVCGPDHIRTFSCRLIESQIPFKVVSFDWCASDESKYGALPLAERPI